MPRFQRAGVLIATSTRVYLTLYPNVYFIQWHEFKYHLLNALKYKRSRITELTGYDSELIRTYLTEKHGVSWLTRNLRKFPVQQHGEAEPE